nr:uncharacterized protein LOC113716116 [Coffea arabica]
MAEEDRDKTSFITEEGTYCYRTMPFGLKNAGATYQRLVNKLFQNQTGRSMEVYVDDMIVKSRTDQQLIPDLREILNILLECRMRLNPKKCTFGVRSGRFLGFLVSRDGIRANPDKLQAIMDMASPRNVKEVQRLTGRMAALNSLSGRAANSDRPRAGVDPIPIPVLLQRGRQCGIGAGRRRGSEAGVLRQPSSTGAETRYSPAEKLVLALVHASRKLRPYFQAHSIVVLTDQPLRQILTKPEVSGRMTKWAVELAEHDLSYRPRTAIKAQALADFLAEGANLNLAELAPTPTDAPAEEPWVLFVDGASSKEGSGARLLLTSPTGEELTYALRFDFPASNNEAEYETLLAGLRIAHQMGITAIRVRSDSQLVVLQVRGEYEAKDEIMKKYLAKVREAVTLFGTFEIVRVPRSQNKRADALSKLASSSFAHLSKEVLVEVVKQKSINQVQCVTPGEGDYVLREVHEGICAAHVGSRVLAKKCLLLGYYWPSVFRDAADLVQKCRACQVHASLRHQSVQEMVPIHSPWPFTQWGIDLVGPFPRAPGRYEHLVVAIDYFTKWVEAEPLVSISGKAIQKFFWKNIVCRFGIPHVLISDNGRQFAENPFRSWCSELEINQHFTSVGHPQANGQVENANRTVLQGLKTRMESAQSNWLDELPSVLWAYRTKPRTATQETPFSLTYGVEAVVPAEVGLPSPRTQNFVAASNEEELRLAKVDGSEVPRTWHFSNLRLFVA